MRNVFRKVSCDTVDNVNLSADKRFAGFLVINAASVEDFGFFQ